MKDCTVTALCVLTHKVVTNSRESFFWPPCSPWAIPGLWVFPWSYMPSTLCHAIPGTCGALSLGLLEARVFCSMLALALPVGYLSQGSVPMPQRLCVAPHVESCPPQSLCWGLQVCQDWLLSDSPWGTVFFPSVLAHAILNTLMVIMLKHLQFLRLVFREFLNPFPNIPLFLWNISKPKLFWPLGRNW